VAVCTDNLWWDWLQPELGGVGQLLSMSSLCPCTMHAEYCYTAVCGSLRMCVTGYGVSASNLKRHHTESCAARGWYKFQMTRHASGCPVYGITWKCQAQRF